MFVHCPLRALGGTSAVFAPFALLRGLHAFEWVCFALIELPNAGAIEPQLIGFHLNATAPFGRQLFHCEANGITCMWERSKLDRPSARQGASGDEQISPGTIIEGQHLAFMPRYRASLRAAQPRSATVSLASDCAQARVTAELSCLLPNVAAQPPFSTKPG